MRLLLDTHTLIWWVIDSPRLTGPARRAIMDAANDVFVSAASAWEIATKTRIGKLPGMEPLSTNIGATIVAEGFTPLPIAVPHAERAGGLPGPHKDPFDRMLIAQALTDELHLVSNEVIFDQYGVARVW